MNNTKKIKRECDNVNLLDIPQDCFIIIAKYLRLKELISFCLCCKIIKNVLYDSIIWKPHLDGNKHFREYVYITQDIRELESRKVLQRKTNWLIDKTVQRSKFFQNIIDVVHITRLSLYHGFALLVHYSNASYKEFFTIKFKNPTSSPYLPSYMKNNSSCFIIPESIINDIYSSSLTKKKVSLKEFVGSFFDCSSKFGGHAKYIKHVVDKIRNLKIDCGIKLSGYHFFFFIYWGSN